MNNVRSGDSSGQCIAFEEKTREKDSNWHAWTPIEPWKDSITADPSTKCKARLKKLRFSFKAL